MANLKATACVLQIRDGMVIWSVTGTCTLFASTDCLGDLIKLQVLPGEEVEEPLEGVQEDDSIYGGEVWGPGEIKCFPGRQ